MKKRIEEIAVKEINISELKALLDRDPKGKVLDVRSADEYGEGHIPNSVNIPHDEVMMEADRLREFETIYIHCKKGGRAKMAADTLEQMGFQNLVCVSEGGMPEWIEAGNETS